MFVLIEKKRFFFFPKYYLCPIIIVTFAYKFQTLNVTYYGGEIVLKILLDKVYLLPWQEVSFYFNIVKLLLSVFRYYKYYY